MIHTCHMQAFKWLLLCAFFTAGIGVRKLLPCLGQPHPSEEEEQVPCSSSTWLGRAEAQNNSKNHLSGGLTPSFWFRS